MESPKAPLRYKLILGKFRVTHAEGSGLGVRFTIHFPGLGTMTCLMPANADIREGDLLTLYTEVLGNAPNA